jgi:predicted transcriptional regulator
MSLHQKLRDMRSLGLLTFEEQVVDGKTKIDDLKPTTYGKGFVCPLEG